MKKEKSIPRVSRGSRKIIPKKYRKVHMQWNQRQASDINTYYQAGRKEKINK